ncbi:MAG: flagellar assembly protein FliW [Ilumatobacteraceae bacterium]
MQVHTRRFGSIVVDDDEVYAVPNGIPGFPELRRVVLLGAGPAPGVNPGDDSSLYWMQDLDDGDLAFMCLVPWEIFPDYEIDIDERTRDRRGGGRAHPVARHGAPHGRHTASHRQPARTTGRRRRSAPCAAGDPLRLTVADPGPVRCARCGR